MTPGVTVVAPPVAALTPQAAIFDLDGTLIDSLPLTFAAFREALGPILGRDLTDSEIYARFGPADHEIVAAWAGPQSAGQAVERLMKAYQRGLGDIEPYRGVPAMLEGLKQRGIRLALCTGRGRPSTTLLLEHLRFSEWFEWVVTGEDVPKPKPAPDGVLRTAGLLGLPTERILYAGDSVKDVEAGLAAGCFTVAALWAGTEGSGAGFERAHARAYDPGEIVELLESRRSG